MPRHDPLLKELLEAFFGDLLHLVVPHLAARLQLDRDPKFLSTEMLTDVAGGERRQVDVLAKLASREGEPEVVLVHVEIEGQARRRMARRLWHYLMALRLRFRERQILPILINLRGGPADISKQTLRDELWGEELATFSYYCFGLSGSDAAAYLERPEPLAWALASLMRKGRWAC